MLEPETETGCKEDTVTELDAENVDKVRPWLSISWTSEHITL